MPKLKKVNYQVEDIRYWTCSSCYYINETDVDSKVDIFPECETCGEKFEWGIDECTLEECKKGYEEHDFCVVNTNTGKTTCCNCGAEKPIIPETIDQHIENLFKKNTKFKKYYLIEKKKIDQAKMDYIEKIVCSPAIDIGVIIVVFVMLVGFCLYFWGV